MQTRRDRVQAYNFTVGRLGTAMLEANPDATDQPMRRTRTGTYIGLIIGALICVGFLVFGLLMPGGATSWRKDGQLVVERDTGATYLYGDGELRPVANYTSARLVSEGEPEVSRVKGESLDGVPVGAPVGIPGAPDALPSIETAADNVWRMCAMPPGDDGEARSALTVDPETSAGDSLNTDAALVAGPDDDHHLLWNGKRLRLNEEGGALQAMGYGTVTATVVPQEFLDAIPEGPDLAAPDVGGAGGEGPDIAGGPTRVGQVFAVEAPSGNGADEHYLLTEDGLVPVTQTDAALVLANPDIAETVYDGGEPAAIGISAGDANAHLSEDAQPAHQEDEAPATPPDAAPIEGQVPCVTSSGDELAVELHATDSVAAEKVPETTGTSPGCPTPDLAGIPAGAGGVATADPAGGNATSAPIYLVTDTPAKYRVPSEEVLTTLGYKPGDAVDVPTDLLRLLPTGPELSPEAAALPVADAEPDDDGECP